MKKIFLLSFSLLVIIIVGSIIFYAVKAKKGDKGSGSIQCTTIREGTLTTTDGEVIETGYSGWGYKSNPKQLSRDLGL